MKVTPKIKSKKFVVYFYQDGDGGTICGTNSKGLMDNKSNYLFSNKREAINLFTALVDCYLKK